MFPVQDEVEELASFAVPSHNTNQIKVRENRSFGEVASKNDLLKDKEADVVPFPDLVQLDDVRVILRTAGARVRRCKEESNLVCLLDGCTALTSTFKMLISLMNVV